MTYSPLSSQYTEAAIKADLDGTWTRITFDGGFITELVEPDFVPYLKAGRLTREKNAMPQAYWLPDDDATLQRMRLLNRPIQEIPWLLHRTPASCLKRAQLLRVRGGG
jgi:hypothetical protein